MIVFGAFLKEILPKQSYVQQLTSYQSKIREGEQKTLHAAGDLAYTNAILLADTIIIHSWFLQLM